MSKLLIFCRSFQRSKLVVSSGKIARTFVMSEQTRNLTIGTHDGKFHCDEALACFILKELPRFAEAKILRTRDAKQLATCDAVVDVGGEYDPERLRFDHHQASFTHSMRTLKPEHFGKLPLVKLSSAGLIWHHFGAELIDRVLSHLDAYRVRFSSVATRRYLPEFATTARPRTDLVFRRIYETFMLELDAIDNGVSQCPCPDTEVRYHVSTGLAARVDHLNSTWNEETTVDLQNSRFAEAMQLAGGELIQRILGLVDVWWPSRAMVEEAFNRRFEVDASGAILQLERGGCPWKEHLSMLEEENEASPRILFVLYPEDSRVQDGARRNWRVQTVPVASGSFESRMPLAAAWRGLRDAELSQVSGIPDCIFVHASGFIGGNQSAAGALELARRTMALAEQAGGKRKIDEASSTPPDVKRNQLD